jgi:hypothetical protein
MINPNNITAIVTFTNTEARAQSMGKISPNTLKSKIRSMKWNTLKRERNQTQRRIRRRLTMNTTKSLMVGRKERGSALITQIRNQLSHNNKTSPLNERVRA